jgi:hypothetical protein
MTDPEMIYLAEDEIIITGKWAIFGKQRYSMDAIETVWLEERYLNFIAGILIALLGLLLLVFAPALLKLTGLPLMAIGVGQLQQRSYLVVLALSIEEDAPTTRMPEDSYIFKEAFTSDNRKLAQDIVDAIKVAKIHKRPKNYQPWQ